MTTPVILKWTVIPANIVARAWTDKKFKREFLLWPTQVLNEVGVQTPRDITFCVIENTPEEHYLVLPYRHPKTYGWSKEKIEAALEEEMGCDDNSLEYWLPIDIMVEAFFDQAFKKRLYTNLNEVLTERGYNLGDHNYIIVENTEKTYHMVLPINKWPHSNLDAEALEGLIIQDFLRKYSIH